LGGFRVPAGFSTLSNYYRPDNPIGLLVLLIAALLIGFAVFGQKRTMNVLNRAEEWLIAGLIASATLLIFAAVVHRYGTGLSINLSKWAAASGYSTLAAGSKSVFNVFQGFDMSWSQELCIFMFVWMAKFGASYGVRTGAHVGVDVALNNLTSPSKYRTILFGLFSGALFTAIIAAFGARFVFHTWEYGTRSNDLEMPMWLVFLAIPLGSALMSFRFLQVAYNFSKEGELPHEDEGHVEGLDKVVPSATPVPHLPANVGVAQGAAR
jgi:C4-dicarboxylate transporter, DctM subunit